jgi:ribosomal protein S27AE
MATRSNRQFLLDAIDNASSPKLDPHAQASTIQFAVSIDDHPVGRVVLERAALDKAIRNRTFSQHSVRLRAAVAPFVTNDQKRVPSRTKHDLVALVDALAVVAPDLLVARLVAAMSDHLSVETDRAIATLLRRHRVCVNCGTWFTATATQKRFHSGKCEREWRKEEEAARSNTQAATRYRQRVERAQQSLNVAIDAALSKKIVLPAHFDALKLRVGGNHVARLTERDVEHFIKWLAAKYLGVAKAYRAYVRLTDESKSRFRIPRDT